MIYTWLYSYIYASIDIYISSSNVYKSNCTSSYLYQHLYEQIYIYIYSSTLSAHLQLYSCNYETIYTNLQLHFHIKHTHVLISINVYIYTITSWFSENLINTLKNEESSIIGVLYNFYNNVLFNKWNKKWPHYRS